MGDLVIEDINLETELAGYENVFRVGDTQLYDLLGGAQAILTNTIQQMKSYKASVEEALVAIKTQQELDKQAAEAAAAQAAAQSSEGVDWGEVLEAAGDAYNSSIGSGGDMPAAAGAWIGGAISELIDQAKS